jgi:hypothetical protein
MSEPIAKRRPMIDLDEFERRLRHPSSASRAQEDDPLAELARLVGSQDDPYKAMFVPENPQPAPVRPSDAGQDLDAAPRTLRQRFTPAEDEAHVAYAPPEPAPPRDRRNPERATEFPTPDPAVDTWSQAEAGEGDYPVEFPGEAPRSRRPLYLMSAIIVLGIAGIGASFVLNGARTGQQEIATIAAPDGPAKVAVEATTSGNNGSEASVLERGQQGQRVGLVDTREQPVDLSQMPERTAREGSGKGAISAAHVPVPAPPGQVQGQGPAQVPAQAQRAPEAPSGIAALIEPRKVKTVSVRPDGTIVPQSQAPAAPPPAADAPLPARRPATPVAKAATPKSTERAPTTPKPVAAPSPAAEARESEVAALSPASPAPAASGAAGTPGTWAVQLAAPESEQEARAAQVKIAKKLGADLAGYRTSIRKAAVGEKTVYRVRVGDLSREEAVGLCQKMKSGGTDCFVAKN